MPDCVGNPIPLQLWRTMHPQTYLPATTGEFSAKHRTVVMTPVAPRSNTTSRDVFQSHAQIKTAPSWHVINDRGRFIKMGILLSGKQPGKK